jgi:nucleotide-binding universal stress UspA family protein
MAARSDPGATRVAIKDILVHLESDEEGRSVIDFAASLAAMTGAHLTAAGVVVEYPPPARPSMAGLSSFTAFERLTQERHAAIEEAYQKLCASGPADVQTALAVIQGYRGPACRDFARVARYFDLSILGQAKSDASLNKHVASETLFGSGRPVFFVPFIHKGPARLGKAMICWDGGVQAARALAAAMPLLALSRSFEVVRIGRDLETDENLDLNICRHLLRHDISAKMTELPAVDSIGDAILSYAADSGADYIVMGAYGHWRFTEFVIGGTTRTILASMTAPVLMAH